MADKDKKRLLSVGIDIGTTTTHLIISSLKFGNTAGPTQVSKLGITDKEILFQSPIHLTPLDREGAIDAQAVAALVQLNYAEAARILNFEPIETGAVIITGESAAKRNAEEVCQAISRFAGAFVVESAGANLESIFCARGSAAQAISKQEGINVLSLDIGGGTSNFALVQSGLITSVGAIAIGGRSVRFVDGRIEQISESAAGHSELIVGLMEKDCQSQLQMLADDFAAIILGICRGESDQNKAEIWLTEKFLVKEKPDLLLLSGGVAELMRTDQEQCNKDKNKHNDFGFYLAQTLKDQLDKGDLKYTLAENAIRATVLGAGMHTLQLTGSTIGCSDEDLPLRNLPLIKIDVSAIDVSAIGVSVNNVETIPIDIQSALALRAIDWSKKAVAISINGLQRNQLQYERVRRLAEVLADAQKALAACDPLVITVDQDIAMALNQLLKRLLPDKRIITLDGIVLEDGDYLDIGKPVNRLSDPNTRHFTRRL